MKSPIQAAMLALAFLLLPPLEAQVLTTRVSVSSSGAEGGEASTDSDLSADGRYVVFVSESQFDPRDTNAHEDVYRRDRQTGVTELVSLTPGNLAGDLASYGPEISGDGRWVVFLSDATDLVPGDTNGFGDAFLRDMVQGQTTRVSVGVVGNQGNGLTKGVAISEDGLWTAFSSTSSNLLVNPINNLYADIYLRDRQGVSLQLITSALGGGLTDHESVEPSLSADGGVVVFRSEATNLVANDNNSYRDIFRHEVATGKTTLVSVDSNGNQANDHCLRPSVSGDGQRVVYDSRATNLAPGDTNQTEDVFGYLVPQKSTFRISVAPGGAQASGERARISGDGKRVAFESAAMNLVPGDTGVDWDVFLVDLGSMQVVRVSVDSMGNESFGPSGGASIDGDGTLVGYWTFAPFPGDTNVESDVYVSDPVPAGRGYCTAGTSANGCQVNLQASGVPSRSLASGYTLDAAGVEGSKNGIFYFGTNGRQANPWGTGTSYQCVVPPVKRTGVQPGVGSNGACNGFASLDFNTWMALNPTKAPPSGILTQVQFWFRDPQNTSNQTTSLSDAFELVVAP